MRRKHEGLGRCAIPGEIADGLYLVRVQRASYRWHPKESFYELHFYVVEPKTLMGAAVRAHISCGPKSLWRLGWFLRDFGYRHELLTQDEIDTGELLDLRGVIQVDHETVNGERRLILKGFAPASDWPHLVLASTADPEVA